MRALFDRSETQGCVSYAGGMLTASRSVLGVGNFRRYMCGSGLHAPCGEPKPAVGARGSSILAPRCAVELNDGR